MIYILFAGIVSTYAGSSRGCLDGPALQAQFYYPGQLAFDKHSSSLYIIDSGNGKIRVVSANGKHFCEYPLYLSTYKNIIYLLWH